MIDSDEEYVMEFKAEEKRTYLSQFHLDNIASDCSTLSASEIDSYDTDDVTPPLLYKIKKARVLIKKLPRNVLAKYNISSKTSPIRTSGRIKDKHIPAGKYLALHTNKPLDIVMTKKQRRRANVLKTVDKIENENQKNTTLKRKIFSGHSSMKRNLNSRNLSSYSSSKSKDNTASKNIPNISYSLYPRKLLCSKLGSTVGENNYRNEASSITTTTDVEKRKPVLPKNARSLHERIAATRIIHKSTENSVPTLPNVVITHDIPPTSRTHHAAKPVPHSKARKALQNEKTSVPLITSYPEICCPQNVQSKVFPAFITPAASIKPIRPSYAGPSASTDSLKRQSVPAQRKFTIQAFKIPNDSSKTNDPIPVASPRVFVVNQSLLGIDPLSMPNSECKNTKKPERQIGKENTADNCIGVCVDSDSDLEQADVGKRTEPEVIKRIIYHTKSVQTKFTCNSSICGLVDSDEFNLNCFYCYDIFPLHKWFEFKEHIKNVHHVEERANISDSDIDSDIYYSRNRQKDCSKNMSSMPRYMNQHGNQNFTANAVNTNQHAYKKLPLEPRLLAQRQNKTDPVSSKLFSSTPKNSKPSKSMDQKGKSNIRLKVNTSQINEIINLDSDDCDLGIGEIYVKKSDKRDLLVDLKGTNEKTQMDQQITQVSDSKLILPSLPHITIKKVVKTENNTDVLPKASERTANENFIKIPSATNIQKVIKTLPKPTTSQLTDNSKTRPRYFVVKKIIKLPSTDEISQPPDINIPKGTILTKMSLESKNDYAGKSVSMASTDNIEDSIPKPTSGLGILFGLTNSMVVIEFLLKLKTFPELWRCQLENNDPAKYNESVKKLCSHLNNRFDLNMTEFEMRLSIQRVKDWYYLMLQSIHEHNKDPNKTEPYKHRFPVYFRILSQYLTPDADEKGVRLNEIINKTTHASKLSTVIVNENATPNADGVKSEPSIENVKTIQPSTISATTSSIVSSNKNNSENKEVTADSLIEFDADTLYDQESSDEETVEEFDESIFFTKKPNKKTINLDGTPRKRTKVYLGSFECDICHKIYKRSCDLKRHRVIHLPPQFECGRCSQKFHFKHWAERCNHVKNKNSKYKKVDKASGEKRIWPKKIFRFNMICEICGNSYRSIGSLNTHKRDKHFNQRNTCVVCNFTALSNWRIVQHQRKRHIVEPGLPEEVAKKSRPRTESKSSFSNEARQAFDWRREMRKKMKPGEKFYGCCRCKIVFNTRKEKVFHNKIEHPITEYTVFCLLCLPNKLLLSNSNCARRHYIDIHKVSWHEIDGLVKLTKPIFNLLNKEEIELLKASENYKELLEELLKDKKLQSFKNVHIIDEETSQAVENLPHVKELDESTNIVVECSQEQNVYVDGTTDNDHCSESNYKQLGCASVNEHNYSEEHVINENFNEFDVLVSNSRELYSEQVYEEGAVHMNHEIENNDCEVENYIQNDEYVRNIVGDFVEGELVEESIVVEEYIDEIIGEDEEELYLNNNVHT